MWRPHNSVSGITKLQAEVNIVVVGWKQCAQPANFKECAALDEYAGSNDA